MSELILQAVAEVCVSTVEQGGVAGAEFSVIPDIFSPRTSGVKSKHIRTQVEVLILEFKKTLVKVEVST